MRVIKPNWVEHFTGDKKTRSPIYSISVHPDGTRLATGGQDNKVKIWSTLPILDEEAQENEANYRLLCTMSAHTGPVLTVRWAHHGRYLASGADDAVVLVWDLDPSGGGRVFGSEEVNVENWKAFKRLVGHIADVVDCAWNRDDSMLASVGLDSKIFIWDGYSFDRLRTIDAHQGFVKGVTWDPVGSYLATQSDDKTVRIWSTESWKEVEMVSRPFELSPQSTFFRRLSWSPDGAFIAASNAMNGPVFVAAVIEREGWTSDISFVGHENTIQVAAFNPRLFFPAGEERSRINASCMVALGADDYSISIWRNTRYLPLAVIRDIFTRQILDLCWANDGLTLYGCSADGTVCAVNFTANEFPELAEPEATGRILKEYHDYKESRARPQAPRILAPVSSGFAQGSSGNTEQVNILKPRKAPPRDRRRINLSGTMGGATMANGSANASSIGRAPLTRPTSATGLQRPSQNPSPPRGTAMDAFAAAADQPLSTRTGSEATARMLQGARNAMFTDDDVRIGDKRKALDDESDRVPKGRVMGGASRPIGTIQEIRAPRVIIASGGAGSTGRSLPVSSVQNVLRIQQDDGAGVVTADNMADGSERNSVTFATNGKDVWVDFVSSPTLAIAAGSTFCAAASEDGVVRIYSVTGRPITSLKLPAPASELAASKDMLMIVTADCQVRVIDTRHGKTVLPPTSISHLLEPASTSSEAVTITSALVRPNGCPVIITSEPAAWAFDQSYESWTQIASPWWAASPLSDTGRTRHSRGSPAGWILAEIEQRVAGPNSVGHSEGSGDGSKPKWWDEALSIGHYETRLRAATLLASKDEYRHWLKEYAKYLGDENFRERAEELIAELMGPLYQLSSKSTWEPTMLGISKRDLAKDALYAMRSTVSLGQFASDQLTILKRIQHEETRWA